MFVPDRDTSNITLWLSLLLDNLEIFLHLIHRSTFDLNSDSEFLRIISSIHLIVHSFI